MVTVIKRFVRYLPACIARSHRHRIDKYRRFHIQQKRQLTQSPARVGVVTSGGGSTLGPEPCASVTKQYNLAPVKGR